MSHEKISDVSAPAIVHTKRIVRVRSWNICKFVNWCGGYEIQHKPSCPASIVTKLVA